jgi:hypothetical protein
MTGTKAEVEANLWEPPRLTMRRTRSGEPALMKMVEGVIEAKDVFKGSTAGFWKKLAGRSSYDGLPQLIRLTYSAIQNNEPPPIPLDEIEATAKLVEQFTAEDIKI